MDVRIDQGYGSNTLSRLEQADIYGIDLYVKAPYFLASFFCASFMALHTEYIII